MDNQLLEKITEFDEALLTLADGQSDRASQWLDEINEAMKKNDIEAANDARRNAYEDLRFRRSKEAVAWTRLQDAGIRLFAMLVRRKDAKCEPAESVCGSKRGNR
jgi:hypothetical protein